ncbi:MAG: formimidoylglutamate deiminase [Pseudomonadota bacterium]
MQQIYCEQALLPSGWASSVTLDISNEGTISAVREQSTMPDSAQRKGTVIPALASTHSHAFQRAMAGLCEQLLNPEDTFWTWRETMYRFANAINPDDLQAIAAQLYVEMLKAGFAQVGEFHYVHHQPGGQPYANIAQMADSIVNAAELSGIGVTLLPVLYATAGFDAAPLSEQQSRFGNSEAQYLDLHAQIQKRCGAASNTRCGAAMHSLRAVPPDLLLSATDELRRQNPEAPIHIHISEQMAEVTACEAVRGARPVQWLADNLDLNVTWCLVHATHIDDAEIGLITNSGASVSLCPTTEANLGDGLFPLQKFLRSGGKFSVGSDSNVSVSPVEELRLLEYGQRLNRQIRNVAADESTPSTGEALLQAASNGGASALGQAAAGLSVGARADLLVLDTEHPLLCGSPLKFRIDSWLFAGNTNAVSDVMSAGVWQIKAGKHENEEAIANEFRRVQTKLRNS